MCVFRLFFLCQFSLFVKLSVERESAQRPPCSLSLSCFIYASTTPVRRLPAARLRRVSRNSRYEALGYRNGPGLTKNAGNTKNKAAEAWEESVDNASKVCSTFPWE